MKKDISDLQMLWGGADAEVEDDDGIDIFDALEQLPPEMQEVVAGIVSKLTRDLKTTDQMRGFIRALSMIANVGALGHQFAKANDISPEIRAMLFEMVLAMVVAQCINDPEIKALAKEMGIKRDEKE